MAKPVCVVTGVGPGNGCAFARRFAQAGYRVAMLARSMGCEGALADSPAALQRLLAGKRPKDRPLVIGATIDPAQYTQQF